jgi:hypothetical protein
MAILGSTSLTGCNSIPDFIGTGSLMLFFQTSAPTSWVKQTTDNDVALRVVNGTVSPGGSISFSSAFPNSTKPISSPVTVSGTVGNHTLTTTEIPSHTHPIGGTQGSNRAGPGPQGTTGSSFGQNGATGGSGAHSHPFTESSVTLSTTLDLRVQYVDVIVASKS